MTGLRDGNETMNARAFHFAALTIALVSIADLAIAQTRPSAADELRRIVGDYGEEAERRFVRAFRHLDGDEYREMSQQFLQRRERELRRFLTRYPLADEAHRGRLMLARTLLYRDGHDEAASLLKMVLLTSGDASLERDAKFALAGVYRKHDPVQARALLLETASDPKTDADSRARAYLELAGMSDGKVKTDYLRHGASGDDGTYRRQCWQRLVRQDPKALEPGSPAPAFAITATDGKTPIDTRRLAGDVYVVCYWSSRTAELDRIRSLVGVMRQNHGSRGLHVFGVCLDGDLKRLRTRVAEQRDPWIEAGDAWGRLHELAIRHGVDRAPMFVVVDATGHLRFRGPVDVPESVTAYAQTPLWKIVEHVVDERAQLRAAQ